MASLLALHLLGAWLYLFVMAFQSCFFPQQGPQGGLQKFSEQLI